MKKKTLRIIGITTLILGALLFVYIGIISVWGELEASFFNAGLRSEEPLETLSCPAVITSSETAAVSGTFYNPFDKTANMEIRTYVTAGFVTLMNEFITTFTLEPGNTKIVEVPIIPEDAAYERVIMVRMHQMKRIPFPYQNASCGIVVINFPLLTGAQFITLILSLGTVLTAGGITLWAVNSKPIVWLRLKIFVAMIIFALTSASIAAVGLMGIWGLALIMIVIWIFMGLGMIWQFSTASKKNLFNQNLGSEIKSSQRFFGVKDYDSKDN